MGFWQVAKFAWFIPLDRFEGCRFACPSLLAQTGAPVSSNIESIICWYRCGNIRPHLSSRILAAPDTLLNTTYGALRILVK